MKTAISLPDALFERVAHHAERLGMSRSEFFAVAASRWVDELEGPELTAAVDLAIENAGSDEDAEFTRTTAGHLFDRAG